MAKMSFIIIFSFNLLINVSAQGKIFNFPDDKSFNLLMKCDGVTSTVEHLGTSGDACVNVWDNVIARMQSICAFGAITFNK